MLACLPLMLALFNRYWIFTNSQSALIDPWLYVSFFLHLKPQLITYNTGYYGDRLSVLLPGWLIYKIFGAWVGNYIYKLVVIYTSSFTFYFLSRDLFGRRTALVCGLAGIAQPFFLMAYGWDYVDGIGVAYCMLSLYFAFRAARLTSYKLCLFLCGVFLNCTISSQFLWMNLVWIVPVAYFWANWLFRRHSIWASLFWMGAGFACTFVVFCAIHYVLNGQWLYLTNTLFHTLHNFGAAQKVNRPLSLWLRFAIWLVYDNGLMLPAVWVLLRRGTSSIERMCLGLFLGSYITVWGWQAVQFPFAMDSYYTSFLFPAYLMGLAAVLNQPLLSLGERQYRFLVAVCLAVGIGIYSLVSIWDRMGASFKPMALGNWLWSHDMIALSIVCMAVSIPVCLWRTRQLLPVLVFILGFFLVDTSQLMLMMKSGWFSGGAPDNRQGFRIVLDADAWVNRLAPDRKILWWSDGQESGQGIVTGITSLYMWGYTILNDHFPDLAASDVERLHEDHPILVLSWKPDALQTARAAFSAHGLQVTSEQTTTVADGGVTLELGMFHVVPRSAVVGRRVH